MLRRSNPPTGMARPLARRPGAEKTTLLQWIRPQLARLVNATSKAALKLLIPKIGPTTWG